MTWDVLKDIAAIISPIIAVLALSFSLIFQRSEIARRETLREEESRREELRSREQQLRTGQVLDWVNLCIAAFQRLVVTLRATSVTEVSENLATELDALALEMSTLTERGRMFFQNTQDQHGNHKPPAYRGYRPEILDHLVVAFRVAQSWSLTDAETRRRMRFLTFQSAQMFVSLAQMEVGRSKVGSEKAGAAGDGGRLMSRLAEIDESEMKRWEEQSEPKRLSLKDYWVNVTTDNSAQRS